MEQLVFNELSLCEYCNNQHIVDFYNIWKSLKKILKLEDYPKIRFSINQLKKCNSNGQNLSELIKNAPLNEEDKSNIYNVIMNAPYVEEHISGEVLFNGLSSEGLTDAYYFNIPSISLPSHNDWQKYIITATALVCDENTNDVINKEIQIKNIGNISNYQNTWLEELIKEVDSEKRRNDYISFIEDSYENIILSDDVKNFLESNENQSIRNSFENAIRKLNTYCLEYWNNQSVRWNSLKELGLNVRPESDSVMNDRNLLNLRNFFNERRSMEIITYHFDVCTFRAYVKEIMEQKKFFIAYLGPHLSTKLY